jgi:transposase
MNSAFSFLPSFKGILVHDCLPAYFKFEQAGHALCGAHLLRELEALIQQGSHWGRRFSEFLRRLLKIPPDRRRRIRKFIEGSYDVLCRIAHLEEPPPQKTKTRDKCTKGRNLLKRLIKYKQAVLAFAFDEKIPFTNNLAERDVRPVKLKQKVSNSFRTLHGARIYARIESFISTARKQGQNIFNELKNTFSGYNFLTPLNQMT